MLDFLSRWTETKQQSIARRINHARIRLAAISEKLNAIVDIQKSNGGYLSTDNEKAYLRLKEERGALIKEIELLEAEDKKCAS